jgi:hypothetical protein
MKSPENDMITKQLKYLLLKEKGLDKSDEVRYVQKEKNILSFTHSIQGI